MSTMKVLLVLFLLGVILVSAETFDINIRECDYCKALCPPWTDKPQQQIPGKVQVIIRQNPEVNEYDWYCDWCNTYCR